MAEIPNPSEWLFNTPLSGIPENFYLRNKAKIEQTLGMAWMIDDILVLNAPFETWVPGRQDRYKIHQVTMTKIGPEVPPRGSELWQIWQEYTNSEEGQRDFNGSKLHLHWHGRVLTDTNLVLVASQYDWHRMRTLGISLREGRLPNGNSFPNVEKYRDRILPIRTRDGYKFPAIPPNNIVVHLSVETADGDILVTQKPPDADYDPNALDVTIEEQMHGQRDRSPFDTADRAINKVGGEELKLTLIPEETIIGAMGLESRVNGLAILMAVKVTETSEQISAGSLGADRAEFDPAYLRKVSLDDLIDFMDLFYNPRYLRHGTMRLRMLLPLYRKYGFIEGNQLMYQSYHQYH